MGASLAGFAHSPRVLAFYMQVSSELLSKSFLCSCSAWVHQADIEISHPLVALFGNCSADQQEQVGKGQRSLLALGVAVGGGAAKCKIAAASSKILFWVYCHRARFCCMPECLLLTKHWISLVNA